MKFINYLFFFLFASIIFSSCEKKEEANVILQDSSSTSGVTFYVDKTNGLDKNTGTSADQAWKTIQKACNSATPGSVVYIKGGTYNENIVVNVSGTATSPITFKNYNSDPVIVDGTGKSGSILLQIEDKSYLNFEGIVFQNVVKNGAKGILVECSSKGKVTSLSFKKIVIRNIKWTSSATTLPGDEDNAQPFIVYGRGTTEANAITDLVVDSCEMYNNYTGFSEVLSIDGNVKGFTVTNNIVHDNTNIGIYAGGNYGECSVPSLDHARNGLIEKNICYKNVSSYATSGGIYADGSQNVVIRRNISCRNGYGIEVGAEENGTTENITVINNLVYKNQESGIAVGGWTTETTGQVLNSTFRNNTLYWNDSTNNGSGEFYITKASNCTFENNIVYSNKQNIFITVEKMSPQTSNKFNYNCYFSQSNSATNIEVNWRGKNYTSFVKYQSGSSQDKNSLYANPKLTNIALTTPDFGLLPGSLCINGGNPSTVVSAGETDFMGNIRMAGGRIDIGAVELQ
jgi:hypothetical protein